MQTTSCLSAGGFGLVECECPEDPVRVSELGVLWILLLLNVRSSTFPPCGRQFP